jgi:hypothetical protein
MNDRRPRVRVNQQMWCQTCAKDTSSPSGKYKPGSDIRLEAAGEFSEIPRRTSMRTIALREHKTGQRLFVLAHDSGDGETIYHCPFCGSGQVLARSDRTIECEFCHTSFTVQVQPEYSAFPQTMDGQPIQVPGMPGQIDQPVGGGPADPAIAAPDSDGDGIPDQEPSGAGFDAAAPASADNQPPWLTAGLRTQAGKVLPVEDYVRHLAIKHSGTRREAVLRSVRASRESS